MTGMVLETGIPAVIVRGEVNGLGVVRSLAKSRVPSIVVDTTLRRPAMWSRWSKRHVVDQLFGRPFVDGLLTLQQQIGIRPVLILTDELAVVTLSDYRAELLPYYRFHLPSRVMVTTLFNKASFQRFAEQHALPVPRAVIVERESDLARIPELGMPVIVKPADKLPVHLGRVERVRRLGTMAEITPVGRRMLNSAGPLVVQEWVDGPDSDIYFSLFHCGRSPTSRHIFLGRKIAAHPPGVGSTAVCVSAPEAASELRPLTEKFLDMSEYEGLGSLEFKWNRRTRRFVIIEPTVGRTDSQEEIAALNGVNLALVAYCHALGLPAPPVCNGDAAAWRESFLHLRRCAGLGVPIFDGYWRKDDPLPALVFYADHALRAGRKLLRRTVLNRRKPSMARLSDQPAAGVDPVG